MDKLKPCPFCDDIAKIKKGEIQNSEIIYYAECVYCGAKNPYSFSEDQAITNWNTRTPTGINWIPVNEKLPEEATKALCLVEYKYGGDDVRVCIQGNFVCGLWSILPLPLHKDQKVTHWVELNLPEKLRDE